MTNKDFELPQNCDFNAAENNSTTEFACTPKLLDPLFSEFRGLIINAPASTDWPASGDPSEMVVRPNGDSDGPFKLMVSGYLIIDTDSGEGAIELAERVIIVAVDQHTAETYSGKMESIGYRVSPFGENSPGVLDSNNKIETVSSSFNIDLYQNLNIPVRDATYSVYATLDEYKSNSVPVNINLR